MTTASRTKALLSALLAAFLLVASPSLALAVTSGEIRAQLDEANEKLDSLANEVMAAGEALNDTIYKLEETQGLIDDKQAEIDAKQAEIDAKQAEIDETQAKIEETQRRIRIKAEQLAAAQDALSERMVATYKAGPTSLLEIILGSSSFEELQSNIFYAQKVRAQDEERIADVQRAREALEEEEALLEEQKAALEAQQAELEAQQDALEAQQAELLELEAEQQALADEQASQKAALEARQAEQQAYVDQLDADLKEKIEEERQAELERQRQEAARLAEQYGGSGPVQVTDANRQTILNAAYTQLGVSYVWGGYSPGVCFDCSGFTKWCYAQAGITLPHSAYGQSRLLSPRAESDLQPGDLVVWIGGMNPISGNHVAIYIGDGQIIHAVGRGVIIGGLYSVGGYTVAGAVV